MMNCADCDVVEKNSSHFKNKGVNSLIEMRECVREVGKTAGLIFALNLIYILRCEGRVQGSYTESSESQSGLCISLALSQQWWWWWGGWGWEWPASTADKIFN